MKKLLGSAAVAVAALALSHSADASLVVSLQSTGGGNPLAVNAGDTLTFNVVATVSGGANATADEGLQSLFGSFESDPSGGGPVGDFSTFTAITPFNATSQPGVVQDLNGLPGLDVGSNDKTSSANYLFARDGSMDIGATPDATSFVIGTLTWHANSTAAGTTQLLFVPRTAAGNAALNTAALWRVDGVNKNPTTDSFSGASFTVVGTPEPGSLALAGIGAAGLLLRRRRK